MTFEEAREQLGFHCGSDARVDDPRWRNGMLSTLRPYCGLCLDVMANVDQCVDAVVDHLRNAPMLDRDVINSLWGTVHFTRTWALHEDGDAEAQRVHLARQRADAEKRVDDFSYRIAMILDGTDDPKCTA